MSRGRSALKLGGGTEAALRAARAMPSLRHTNVSRVGYDHAASEVINYLVSQQEIREWVYNVFRQSRAIVFDAESGRWCGTEAPQQ